MLLPTPLSFIYALLLCFSLAIVFTVTSPPSTTAINARQNDLSKSQESLFPPPLSGAKPITSLPPTPSPPTLSKADETLLRLAARVNPKPSSPKKLAFMFLTTTPLPFAPLWELYFNQTAKALFNIYVHADPNRPYNPPFSGVFVNRTVRAEPSRRHTPGLAAAARRLLAHALLDDPSNAMFALLSPSCIPLHSFNFTYDTLANSEKSFVEILAREAGSYGRWAARGARAMLPEVGLGDFRIGSQFWAMKRAHARLVIGDRRLWAKFGLPCVRPNVCYPEENYFPTLLAMQDPRGCVPATLTHVDWTGRSDGHPRTYAAAEVGPELIVALRKDRPRYGDDVSLSSLSNDSDSPLTQTRHDPFLFARKFAPDAIGPLINIAPLVIFKD